MLVPITHTHDKSSGAVLLRPAGFDQSNSHNQKEKIIKHLTDEFVKSLTNAKHSTGDRNHAYLWAKRRYTKLSEKEKQEILKKTKD